MATRYQENSQWPNIGPNSTQGYLLVMLGELVWRKQEHVWISALVAGLAELGITENAARKAIYRADEKGLISLEKKGRNVRCSIGKFGTQAFLEGSARVYEFSAESPDWDGNWMVVMVSVPESQREIRHFLKTRLRWVGMGSPIPGMWIAPRVNPEAVEILESVEPSNQIYSYVGKFGAVGDEAAMVEDAWGIGQIEQLYNEFIDYFTALKPGSSQEMFSAYVNLIQSWRKFPYIDPQLPRKFLPSPWIGLKGTKVFNDCRKKWRDGASRYWRELQPE